MLRARQYWLLVFVILLVPKSVLGQRVVINEIMYAPTSPEPEWVELLNAGPTAADLSQLTLKVGSKAVPLPNATVGASGFIVLTRDTAALRQARAGTFSMLQCPLPSLRNSGDTLFLSAAGTVDSVAYLPSFGGKNGHSLERRAAWLDGWTSAGWKQSIDTAGATAGRPNSVAVRHIDLSVIDATSRFVGDSITVSVRIQNVGTDTLWKVTLGLDGFSSRTFDSVLPMDSSATLDIGAKLPDDSLILSVIAATPGDERLSNNTVFLSVPFGLKPGSVAINEILFAPINPEPEWIELFNPSGSAERLDACKLYVNASSVLLPLAKIEAGSYRGITSNDSLLAILRGIDRSQLLRCSLPTLPNSGATVRLVDARGRLVDSMYYTPATHSGRSVERIDPFRPSPDSSAWRTCTDTSGSTLLRANSCEIKHHEAVVESISLSIDSLRLIVRNAGLDTMQPSPVTIAVEGEVVGTLQAPSLPPYSEVTILFPANFITTIGLSGITAAIALDGDENTSNDTGRIVTHAPIRSAALAINEILFQPAVGDCEWIEVVNTTDSSISLRDCALGIGTASDRRLIEIGSCVIGPHSFGVIAANSSFLTFHPELQTRRGISVLSKSSLLLTNDSNAVTLVSSTGVSIDSVYYRTRWHNPFVADAQGVSLERRSTAASGTDSLNWASCSDPKGSTPLAANSTSTAASNPRSDIAVEIDPNPVLPGAAFPSTISIETASTQSLLRARVFGSGGRAVRILTDGELWSGHGTLSFDGKDDDGRTLAPGLYTLLIEITDANGATTSKRLGVVVAPN